MGIIKVILGIKWDSKCKVGTMPGTTLCFTIFWGILNTESYSCCSSLFYLPLTLTQNFKGKKKKPQKCLQCLCFFSVHLIIISARALHTALPPPLFFSWQDGYNVLKILIIFFTFYTGLEKTNLVAVLGRRKSTSVRVCVCLSVCASVCVYVSVWVLHSLSPWVITNYWCQFL